jgi:hypothetical protein
MMPLPIVPLRNALVLSPHCFWQADGDDEDGEEELCNCEFSLGYGGRILLNNARLRLKRGRRYGLCGVSRCG